MQLIRSGAALQQWDTELAAAAYCRASGVGSFYASKASDTAVEIELTVTMP